MNTNYCLIRNYFLSVASMLQLLSVSQTAVRERLTHTHHLCLSPHLYFGYTTVIMRQTSPPTQTSWLHQLFFDINHTSHFSFVVIVLVHWTITLKTTFSDTKELQWGRSHSKKKSVKLKNLFFKTLNVQKILTFRQRGTLPPILKKKFLCSFA